VYRCLLLLALDEAPNIAARTVSNKSVLGGDYATAPSDRQRAVASGSSQQPFGAGGLLGRVLTFRHPSDPGLL